MTPAIHLSPRGELKPYKDDFYLWSYVPSIAAGAIFTIVFLVLSAAHTWKMWTKRMWFCLPFVIGGYCEFTLLSSNSCCRHADRELRAVEVMGFIGRALASNATDQLGPYILQSFFTLVAPSLFAASIYMTLGRIMRGLGPSAESLSIIRVNWLTKTFVIGDVMAFLIQSTGAGLSATGKNASSSENIVVGGLVIQILFFGLFVVAAGIFHKRYARYCTMAPGGARRIDEFDWVGMLYMLYGVSALILVRCLFRIIEYVMGADAYPLQHEWTLYIFDALLMALTMGIYYWWYPSNIQQSKELRSSSSIGMMDR